MFNFDYSYLNLPDKFYSLTQSDTFSKPYILKINKKLLNSINISLNNKEELTRILLNKK